jgi:PAS domain-containing protein
MLEDLYRLLRSGHVQAQGVVDTMTQPIVVLDQRLCVTTANNAFIKTFQAERDDLLGECLFDLGNGPGPRETSTRRPKRLVDFDSASPHECAHLPSTPR